MNDQVWDGESGKLLRHYREASKSEITRIAMSKDGRTLIVSDSAGGTMVSCYRMRNCAVAFPVTCVYDNIIRCCRRSITPRDML